MHTLRLFFLTWFIISLFPLDVWGGKQGQENPDLPRSITLRAKVIKNYIVENEAKAQIKRFDEGYETAYKPNPIYEFERFSSQTPFSSISFIYEENGFFEKNGEDRIFYGKKCGKGELLFPDNNIIYTKPYLYLENDIIITECRSFCSNECIYYVFPFGVYFKGSEPIRFYYPYAGMLKNNNDIKGAEQVYFSLERTYNKETDILRTFHSDLAHEGIDCLTMGKEGWVKLSSRDREYHRSVFDIPEEQGISAGAALCRGYAKFEYVHQTSEGPLKQVYKSFQYTHPGDHPDLVNILFVQDLDHDSLPKCVDLPLQVDESVKLLNDYLLGKFQEAFQEKIQFKQDLVESDEQGHIAKSLSPFWEDIQSSLVATAKFIDEYPLLADLTINGLQFIMGGPLKFALTKIANYLAGDLIENSKEKAQQFLAEQLGVPPDQIELATAVMGMSVDLFLSQPGNVLKSAKKVIEAAEKRAIKRNFKQRNALKHKRNSLTSLYLTQRKGSLNTQNILRIADQPKPNKTLISSLDLAVGRTAKKSFVRTEKKTLLPGEGKVGTFGQLVKLRKKGDDLTPHHMPQDAYMKTHGVQRNDGISMMMEQPHPGKGGRHRQTRTHGGKPNLSETPREALARDIKDARKIYQSDALYTPEMRESLREVITQNKNNFPQLFNKNQGK